jgi:tight adherence protein C
MAQFDPVLFASVSATLVLFGLMFYFLQDRGERRSRFDIRKRLEVGPAESRPAEAPRPAAVSAARRIAKRTSDFYAGADPRNQRKAQLMLLQAGFMNPNAVGYFLAARLGLALVAALAAGVVVVLKFPDWGMVNKIIAIQLGATSGYFLPNRYVARRTAKLRQENRAGFPDVMDLMIVAAEAGLTLEASIDRIAREIERTYPMLSNQLQLASVEIRAGRPLDEALRAFGERLGLDEVQGFATMIQQSKELGTSIADALRVYSEEMRHKRMMAAEEKAYALPAKLSIPVTAFILPIVIGIAVLPTVVRMMNQGG